MPSQKDQMIAIRVTAAQRTEIETAAERADAHVSSWIREVALRAARASERRSKRED